jgi:hypothetical protein
MAEYLSSPLSTNTLSAILQNGLVSRRYRRLCRCLRACFGLKEGVTTSRPVLLVGLFEIYVKVARPRLRSDAYAKTRFRAFKGSNLTASI